MKTQAELVCHFPPPKYIKQHLGSDFLCMFAVLFKNYIFLFQFLDFYHFFWHTYGPNLPKPKISKISLTILYRDIEIFHFFGIYIQIYILVKKWQISNVY